MNYTKFPRRRSLEVEQIRPLTLFVRELDWASVEGACHPMRISEAVVKFKRVKAAQRCIAQINSVEFCRDHLFIALIASWPRYTGPAIAWSYLHSA